MQVLCAGLTIAAALAAQDTSSYKTTTVDINGNRVEQGPEVTSSISKTGSSSTQLMRSMNGRLVPLERTEERIVSEDASGKVVERIVYRYDGTGNPAGKEKSIIEERRGEGGRSTVTATKYGTDVNGRSVVTERITTQLQSNGDSQTAETTIERPGMSDSLQTVEKQTKVTVKQGDSYEESAMTYRRNLGGDFYQATRRVTEH